MDAAIIIAFSYDRNSIQRPYIPGILIDIYYVFNYLKTLIDQNIYIITDLSHHINITDIKESIIDSSINFDILNLMDTISPYLVNYTSKKQILEIIRKCCNHLKKIFLYYTGHAFRNNILLPFSNSEVCFRYQNINDSVIEFNFLRTIISTISDNNAKIFSIFDCCNFNGFNLPYRMESGIYRLRSKNFITQKFICIASTLSDEVSLGSKEGSLFTKVFFQNLRGYRNIYELVTVVSKECLSKFNQTATIYSSYPDLKIIWRWLLFKDIVNVKLNLIGNYFIVKPENSNFL